MGWRKSKSPPQTGQEYWRDFADTLIAQIEKGTAPWQKSWAAGEPCMPENLHSGQPYRGGNAVYLMAAGTAKGYADNRWATYRQIAEAGGHVKAGERSTRIMFYKPIERDEDRDRTEGRERDTRDRETGTRLMARRYAVFNLEQTEGIARRIPAEKTPGWDPVQACEAVLARGAPIRHVNGDRAWYDHNRDRITVPERSQFAEARDYYLTAMHEAGHSTGHRSRMDRPSLQDGVRDGFGSPAYAREELRAEISAMMTGDRVGMGHEPQHGAAYVKGWVAVLQDNSMEIQRAAADAARITDYLCGERERDRDSAPVREAAKPEPHRQEPGSAFVAVPEPVPAAAVQTPDRDHGRGR